MSRLEQDFHQFDKEEKSNKKSSSGCGTFVLGVVFAVQVLFVIFKLLAIITWAWIWVLMPIIAFVGLILILYGLYLFIEFIEEVT